MPNLLRCLCNLEEMEISRRTKDSFKEKGKETKHYLKPDWSIDEPNFPCHNISFQNMEY